MINQKQTLLSILRKLVHECSEEWEELFLNFYFITSKLKIMEKLSLRKFNNFQINNESLKVVRGGMDICTGGGFSHEWLRDGDSYVLKGTWTWESDVQDSKTGKVEKDLRYVPA